jgi:hypothetical protein
MNASALPCYPSIVCKPDTMTADITFHFPPELFNLLVDTIPLLNRSKKDVLTFFRGAGVPDEITGDLTKKLKAAPSVVKHPFAARQRASHYTRPRANPAAPSAAPTRQLSMTLRFTRRTRP